ncbi:hypothetical protein [Priestia megaterium]|uniref:hypothetical protein n=1 Tax=Priestia megaterium TaxID=1404 RepID=UPI0023D9DAB1|nr:hypothetical protein [Priestia megaterium]MDF2058564.1 hypothetical protein [Priestia megaterium]MDF2064764.1 hypothetical protein [Priestia megaterium]
MIKNFPLLISILIIGVSSSTISMKGHLPTFFEWTLPIMSIILNIIAVIGLSLHVFVYKPMKKAEDNLNGAIK